MCDVLKMIGGVLLVVGTFLWACEQIRIGAKAQWEDEDE